MTIADKSLQSTYIHQISHRHTSISIKSKNNCLSTCNGKPKKVIWNAANISQISVK